MRTGVPSLVFVRWFNKGFPKGMCLKLGLVSFRGKIEAFLPVRKNLTLNLCDLGSFSLLSGRKLAVHVE